MFIYINMGCSDKKRIIDVGIIILISSGAHTIIIKPFNAVFMINIRKSAITICFFFFFFLMA